MKEERCLLKNQMKGQQKAVAVAADDGGEQGVVLPLGLKLRRKVGERRGGTHTPVPSWTTLDKQQQQRSSSARKLGAGLWEAHSLLLQQQQAAASMSRRSTGLLPLPSSPQLPKYAGSSRRHAAASFSGHPNVIERSTEDLLPVSPKSYCSSMEAVTPESSLDLDKRLGESGYSLKTSAESLKVLNRIWVLEKQQASNISLVKALKSELNHAQLHIQELIQEREVYHREMDTLMKRVSEDRIIRKKEKNKTKAALQSVRNELEDERKMRRRSEGLHRKLGKELSEMGSKLKKALNDLEKEREAHKLVVDLCDEFAKGVGDYDQEVRDLMQNHEKGANHRFHQFVLHISETWLNERFKIKAAEALGDEIEKNTISDRLTGEIMAFLQARSSSVHDDANRKKDFSVRRHSVESLHINGAGSAPQDAEDNDSMASDLHCFELKMDADDSENPGSFKLHGKEGIEKSGETKYNLVKYPESSSKVQFEEHADGTDLYMGKQQQLVDRLKRISLHADAEGFEVHTGTSHRDSCNNFPLGQFVPHNEVNPAGDRNKLSSIVQQRNYGHASSELEISECSSKLPQNMKDNSLKEKLLEARLEGKHVRMKASQGLSFGGRQKQTGRQ